VVCALGATCSQLVTPSTHTTGPKNHAAKHRQRTQKYHK